MAYWLCKYFKCVTFAEYKTIPKRLLKLISSDWMIWISVTHTMVCSYESHNIFADRWYQRISIALTRCRERSLIDFSFTIARWRQLYIVLFFFLFSRCSDDFNHQVAVDSIAFLEKSARFNLQPWGCPYLCDVFVWLCVTFVFTGRILTKMKNVKMTFI